MRNTARDLYRRLPVQIRRDLALRPQRRWLRANRYRAWHNRRVGSDAPVVNFYPMLPEPRMEVSWLLRALRMRIGHGVREGSPTIAWDTGTWFEESKRRRLPANAINGRCLDTSKSRVDKVWADVCGYSIEVDPTTYTGLMLIKSEINGAHDGVIVQGPTHRRHGLVHQRFIATGTHNRAAGSRPVIIGREMPVVLDFWRPDQFSFQGPFHCTVKQPSDLFSLAEQHQLLTFADRIGLELGEFDVVRDKETGLIYVIDVNRTSFMPAVLARSGLRACYREMVPAMQRLLESRSD